VVSAPRHRPNRNLGQNFLTDTNILGVIGGFADLGRDDVVLEVGGGEGVLSRFVAAQVAHLHVVELDQRLEEKLRAVLPANATLHMGDAVKLDLGSLDPAPTKVVANLPYGVAATVILRTVEELDGVTTWVAMVQKEVGERLAAGPSTPAYGAPSVLAQLSCDVRVLRAIPRTVFRPVPNVDSVLVGLTRHSPAAPARTRKLVSAGFAHRRKALPRSLEIAWGVPGTRDRAREALAAMGKPENIRAEQLSPEEWLALGAALAAAEPQPAVERAPAADPAPAPDREATP
jgi:16S rRNA (adenine1518-N6/adenine1519-N6)-dimethyltransferase